MPCSRHTRSNRTSAGRGRVNRPVNCLPLSVSWPSMRRCALGSPSFPPAPCTTPTRRLHGPADARRDRAVPRGPAGAFRHPAPRHRTPGMTRGLLGCARGTARMRQKRAVQALGRMLTFRSSVPRWSRLGPITAGGSGRSWRQTRSQARLRIADSARQAGLPNMRVHAQIMQICAVCRDEGHARFLGRGGGGAGSPLPAAAVKIAPADPQHRP
jgi:hypothetical protein